MEFIVFIIVAIISMVVINFVLDKVYVKFPLLQFIIVAFLSIASLICMIVSSENGALYGVLQFLCFYNLFIEVKADEWTTREGRFYTDFFDRLIYTERDVNHYRPGWFNKLVTCAILTAIACLISLLIKQWWAYLIPTVYEIFVSFRIWRNRRIIP